jgi:hypothetical protein
MNPFPFRLSVDANRDSVLPALLALPVLLTLFGVLFTRASDQPDLLKPIHLVTGEWAPFCGESLGGQGHASKVVTAVFREMGYEPEFHYMPWTQANATARNADTNHDVRAAFPFYETPERERIFYRAKTPILEVEHSLFYLKKFEGSIFKNGKLRADVRIIPISSYAYQDDLRADIEEYQGSRCGKVHGDTSQTCQICGPWPDTHAAFRELIEDSDVPSVVPEATAVGRAMLDRHFADHDDEVETAKSTYFERPRPIYLMATKNNASNERLVSLFDEALQKLIANGTRDRLIASTDQQSEASAVVVITGASTGGPILATKLGGKTFVVPSGVSAAIEEWGPSYYSADSAPPGALAEGTWIRVRLQQGPMAGTSVLVDGQTATFEFK